MRLLSKLLTESPKVHHCTTPRCSKNIRGNITIPSVSNAYPPPTPAWHESLCSSGPCFTSGLLPNNVMQWVLSLKCGNAVQMSLLANNVGTEIARLVLHSGFIDQACRWQTKWNLAYLDHSDSWPPPCTHPAQDCIYTLAISFSSTQSGSLSQVTGLSRVESQAPNGLLG